MLRATERITSETTRIATTLLPITKWIAPHTARVAKTLRVTQRIASETTRITPLLPIT